MYTIIVGNLILIVLSSIAEIVVMMKLAITSIEKIVGVLTLGSCIVYSGISTIYSGGGCEFIGQYILFSIVLLLTMGLVFRFRHYRYADKDGKVSAKSELVFVIIKNSEKNRRIYNVRTNGTKLLFTDKQVFIAFLLMDLYYVALVLITKGISGFWNISLSLTNIFERYAEMRGTVLTDMLHLINMIAMPFAYIYLQRKKDKGKNSIVVFLLILQVYLYIVSVGYIGRNQVIQNALLVLIVLFNGNKKEYSLNWKIIVVSVLLFILTMPVMLSYEYIRLGAKFTGDTLLNSAITLFHKETDYGKYYNYCIDYHSNGLAGRYLYWFLTLPIPSAIAGSLKSNVFTVNTYFSQLYLGLSTSSRGYYVALPSILGEAFVINGPWLYWLHAVFVGAIISIGCVCLEKNDDLKLLNLYFAVQTLTVGRAGFAGYAGNLINSMVFYVILMFFVKQYALSRRKDHILKNGEIIK